MTEQVKVRVNQWLITGVAGLFGIWGGYQVLAYRVGANERSLTEVRRDAVSKETKILNKMDDASKERINNSNAIKDLTYNVRSIDTEQKKLVEVNKEIKVDIKSILEKVK